MKAETFYAQAGAGQVVTGPVPACIVTGGAELLPGGLPRPARMEAVGFLSRVMAEPSVGALATVVARTMESDGLTDSVSSERAVEQTVARDADLRIRFAAFVRSHRGRARGLAWRLVGGDDAAADDVTQDAFLKAFRALDGFRDDSSLDTWFYRILVRQAHSYRRWRGLRELWTPTSAEDPADPSPTAAADPMLRRRIARSLDGLSRRQREAFVLVHLEGFTVREAAELLGKPEGTVKSHLHRALRSLRAELADLAASPQAGASEQD